jgi:hypothetical protein
MANVYVAPSGIDGIGVFTRRDFRARETVLCVDDSRIVDDEYRLLRPTAGSFGYNPRLCSA